MIILHPSQIRLTMLFFITLFPIQFHVKLLSTSIMIVLLLVNYLLPIWNEFLLGALPTMSALVLPRILSFVFNLKLNYDSNSIHSTELFPLLSLSISSSLLVSFCVDNYLSCYTKTCFSIPRHTLFYTHSPHLFYEAQIHRIL